MARQNIEYTDQLPDGADKINANDTELYAYAGDGSGVSDASAWRTALGLGTAATTAASAYATAAQGATADSAVQPDERYVANYTPVYDLASSVLASTVYHDLGTFTIAASKKWYVHHVTGTNDSTGDGLVRAFSWDLIAGDDATGDSVRGAIGQVSASGAANVKSIHGTAVGLTGHSGDLVGVVGQCVPVATTNESFAFQATVGDGATAAMVINPVTSGDTMDYGILFRNGSLPVEINTAAIQLDAVGSGDLIRLRDSAGTATLHSVSSTGNVGVCKAASSVAKLAIAGSAGGAAAAEVIRFNRTEDANRYNSVFSKSSGGATTDSALSFHIHNGSTSTSQTQVLTLTGAGAAGINNSSPATALDVTGTIRSTVLLGGAVNLTTNASGHIIRDPSDARLKQDIRPLVGALEILLGLCGVSFRWKDTERFGPQDEVGFIAQDVDKVLPQVVRKDGDYWAMSDRGILAVAVEAMKEMHARLEKSEARITELEARL